MSEENSPAVPHPSTLDRGGPPALLGSIALAMGVIIVSQFGQWLPLPGLDLQQLAPLLEVTDETPFGPIHRPGVMSRVSIFALGLWPFVYAWIVIELVRGTAPASAYAGYRRWLTLLIAFWMALQVASGISSAPHLVSEPGPMFWVATVMTLAAGTMLLLWLGEQITKTGLCDGIWLIIAAQLISLVPGAVLTTWQMVSWGRLQLKELLLLLFLLVGATVIIVLMESATRRVSMVRLTGDASRSNVDLTLRLDYANIIPAVVAGTLLAGIVGWALVLNAQLGDQAHVVAAYLGRGQPLYLIAYAVLIVILTFVVTARAASAQSLVEDKSEGRRTVAGVPNADARTRVDAILSRLTSLTAAYLLAICMLPELLHWFVVLPFDLSGPSMMIVMIVMLDILSRARARRGADAGGV